MEKIKTVIWYRMRLLVSSLLQLEPKNTFNQRFTLFDKIVDLMMMINPWNGQYIVSTEAQCASWALSNMLNSSSTKAHYNIYFLPIQRNVLLHYFENIII